MTNDRERRRAYARNLAEQRAHRQHRAAFLRSVIGHEELIVAGNDRIVVTENRIVEAVRSLRGRTAWDARSLALREITSWNLGERHDRRPFLVLHHGVRTPEARVPAHRFLRWRWVNALGTEEYTTTELSFGRREDPVLTAIVELLRRANVPEGERIIERPEGTREQRIGNSHTMLTRTRGPRWLHEIHVRRHRR